MSIIGIKFNTALLSPSKRAFLMLSTFLLRKLSNSACILCANSLNSSAFFSACATSSSCETTSTSIGKLLPVNQKVVILEEISGNCSVCQDLAYQLRQIRPDCSVVGVDLGKQYICHGAVDKLYDCYGISAEKIAKRVMEVHQDEN